MTHFCSTEENSRTCFVKICTWHYTSFVSH